MGVTLRPTQGQPRFSIVIPNLNLGAYLERTLRSVLFQDYEHREIILVDGGSRDRSREVIDRYRDHFDHLIIEPDTGHADALNKGFAVATGDVLCWLNSDDVFLPGCLSTVADVLVRFPEIQWLTGNTTHISNQDHLVRSHWPRCLSRIRLLCGDCRYIQQESTFWRRSLWQDAGGRLPTTVRLAVDFELWLRFFRHAPLYSVGVGLGAFRMRAGQRSQTLAEEYWQEVRALIEVERQNLAPEFCNRFRSILQFGFDFRSQRDVEELDVAVVEDDLKLITFARENDEWLNPNRKGHAGHS